MVIWWLLLKRCHPKYINVLYNREGVTGLSDDGGIAPGQLRADQVLEFVVEPAEADVASGESEQQEGKVAKKKTKSSAKETTPKPTKKQKQQQKLQQQLQRRQLQQQQRQKDFQQQQHLEIEISQLMQSVQQPQQVPQQQSVQQLQPQQPPQQPQPQQSQQQQQQLQQLQQQRDTMSRLIQLMQKHKVQQQVQEVHHRAENVQQQLQHQQLQQHQQQQQPPSQEQLPPQQPQAEEPVLGRELNNLGNTCFMNAVLQCLTHTLPLRRQLLAERHPVRCNHAGGFCPRCWFVDHVRWASTVVGGRAASDGQVPALRANLRRYMSSYRVGAQEDAHEFLRALVNAIDLRYRSSSREPLRIGDYCGVSSWGWALEEGLDLDVREGGYDGEGGCL